jgi:hypothetical protein
VRPAQGRHPHLSSHLPFPSLSLSHSLSQILSKKKNDANGRQKKQAQWAPNPNPNATPNF